ncbi:MAG: hypothetical protein E6I32_14235 [Chloroflexi bacterium]|nr:MAG: hypothetical protein E6I32_14235 [Chloroflexota bacterium]
MNRSLYGERDYAFGQLTLTLRTSIGLTQAGLADVLALHCRRVSARRRAARRNPCRGTYA